MQQKAKQTENQQLLDLEVRRRQKNSGEVETQKQGKQLTWAEAPAWVILWGPGPGRNSRDVTEEMRGAQEDKPES